MREFLYSEDMAEACIFLMSLTDTRFYSLLTDNSPPLVNIGCGEDLSIKELAELVKMVVSFNGELSFDLSKPDGTMRKLMDVSRLNKLGWQSSTDLTEGLKKSYADFLMTDKSSA